MFQSLRNPNYRLWAGGAAISNIGAWMQRTAQDWLVLTQLTHKNATDVGIVMGLQFAPQVLLIAFTGLAADHFDRRKLLLVTQASLGMLALALGVLTVTHLVQLWQVYVFALLLGCVSAFDAPARQSFVSELVDETDLVNAVALNSTSFNAARMIGPAIAGLLIAAIGTGWLFVLNAASFGAVILALLRLHPGRLHRVVPPKKRKNLAEGFSYVWSRADLKTIMLMVFLIGSFGLTSPIYIATMSVSVFHIQSGGFGLLTTAMAAGSVIGTLLVARRQNPNIKIVTTGAACFGVSLGIAAVMPNYWLFGLALIAVGIASQTITTTALTAVQLTTSPEMRGRVIAIVLAVALGGIPIGGPISGHIADVFGPRWALALAAASGFVSAGVGMLYVSKQERRGYQLPLA